MKTSKYLMYDGIGERLRLYRKKQRLSITDLANIIGVSYGTMHRLETTDRASMYTINALLVNTNINPSYLTEGIGTMLIEKIGISETESEQEIFAKVFRHFYDVYDVTEDELFVINYFLLQDPIIRKEHFHTYAELMKKSGITLSHTVLPSRR